MPIFCSLYYLHIIIIIIFLSREYIYIKQLFKFIILNEGFLAKFSPIKYISLLLVIIIMYITPQKITSENNATNQIITKFWQIYDQDRIDVLVNQGDIVLIDVTADWCITCKINHLTSYFV